MSRADLLRARQLIRLRTLKLDAAVLQLATANAALADAEAEAAEALHEAQAARDHRLAVRAALVADPADAALGLARIDLAEEQCRLADAALELAETTRVEAAEAVAEARLEVRRARARHDAMTVHADGLRRTLARRDEERAAIEAEEGETAMRSAA